LPDKELTKGIRKTIGGKAVGLAVILCHAPTEEKF